MFGSSKEKATSRRLDGRGKSPSEVWPKGLKFVVLVAEVMKIAPFKMAFSIESAKLKLQLCVL